MAFKYFSEKSREKQEVVALLARYGITPAVLQAKAAQQNSDAIQMFEAMTARRLRGAAGTCVRRTRVFAGDGNPLKTLKNRRGSWWHGN